MSIALEMERSGELIEGSGFKHGMSCVSIFESASSTPEELTADRRFPTANSGEVVGDERESCSSSSSSIGKNSDVTDRSSDGEDSGETEVQSSFKVSFDSMEVLEEVLPIRRGISRFYSGKSKSFASLGDASSVSTIKDIAKAENAYTRKRRNLLASSLVWDKNRNFPLRSNNGGISKRPANNFSRSTLALAVAMSSSESNNSTSDDSNSRSPPLLPPLHPQTRPTFSIMSSSPPPRCNFSAWRSFSLADLRRCSASTAINTDNSSNSHDNDDDDPQN